MVRVSLVVLFCVMLFVGGCCGSCPSGQKEIACNVTAESCPKALAEKCSKAATCCPKASTCPKAVAATSPEPKSCSSQLAEKVETPTVKKKTGCGL